MNAHRIAAFGLLMAMAACSDEARPVDPALPMTPPTGPADPRISEYKKNAYQVAQGGRYYGWYGCAACHGPGSGSGPDLGLGPRRHGDSFDALYRFIAQGHAGVAGTPADGSGGGTVGDGIPVEQLWQITAYVRHLPTVDRQKRRREDLDAAAEPHDRFGPVPLR